jgi:hypothetical protein
MDYVQTWKSARELKKLQTKNKTAHKVGIIALSCALIPLECTAINAQQMQNARCSFWMNGNPLGADSCRTSWSNGRVTSINYLAGETPGRGNPETVSTWQDGWVPGKKPECLVYKPTGYAICQK